MTAVIFSFVIFGIGFRPTTLQVVLINNKPIWEDNNTAQIQKTTAKQFDASTVRANKEYRGDYHCTKPDGTAVYQNEPCKIDIQENTKQSAEYTNFVGRGINQIELHTDPRFKGNYTVRGSVNGQTTEFMVDTGASYLSISTREAEAYGIKCKQFATSTTANGNIVTCLGIAQQITFGGFQLNNVEISIMPNTITPLLGMNVLSKFKLEQANGTMKISRL
jgi:clan AA aspartic protease (TIGR02281 family)